MEIRDKNGLTEREFLEAYAKKTYPRPYLTADVALYDKNEGAFLLIKRKGHPYLGRWALPGGFAMQTETIEESARRELAEETGVKPERLEPIGLFSKPGRDPRGWVVTQAFWAETDAESTSVCAGDDAGDARWFRLVCDSEGQIRLVSGDISLKVSEENSDLAFDHGEIITRAIELILKHRKEETHV